MCRSRNACHVLFDALYKCVRVHIMGVRLFFAAAMSNITSFYGLFTFL